MGNMGLWEGTVVVTSYAFSTVMAFHTTGSGHHPCFLCVCHSYLPREVQTLSGQGCGDNTSFIFAPRSANSFRAGLW
jgi:hypothetical protein